MITCSNVAANMIGVLFLTSLTVAHPIPTHDLEKCAAGSREAGGHCVCLSGHICTGSICKDGHEKNSKSIHGYVRFGPQKCTDCACVEGQGNGAVKAPDQPKIDEKDRIDMFIGIKSAPGELYAKRRVDWRKSNCAEQYAAAGIQYRFMIGIPMEKGHELFHHNQGAKDTEWERSMASILMAEAEKYGDIEFLPMRDQYMDINNKYLGLMKYAYYFSNAEYLMEQDDEYCMNLDKARNMISKHESAPNPAGSELYAGFLLWKGDEYKAMVGINGQVAPYMSGWMSFLSRNLVRMIVVEDWNHSILSSLYGTQMDDANSGKWVAYAMEKHNIQVEMVSDRGLVTGVENLPNRSTPL
eukprot:m.260441 g.260441  ORF g.260441 m.260441 type:complete len:355 (+) comp39941_c0_seq1:57-1121(+)